MAKVLLVEDDEALREVLEDALQEAGHRVTQARNGQEALEILTREGKWVVLLDMMLPQVSGLEVIRRLEADPRLANGNRIIAMSAGWASHSKATRPVSPLVVSSVSKPFDLEHLLSLVMTASQR